MNESWPTILIETSRYLLRDKHRRFASQEHPPGSSRVGVVMLFTSITCLTLLMSRVSFAEPPKAQTAAPTEQADQQDPVSITGRLLSPRGEPVAGAKVWLAVPKYVSYPNSGSLVIARAESATNGRFQLTPLKELRREAALYSRRMEIWTWKAGYGLTFSSPRTAFPEDPVEVRMEPEQTSEFTMQMADGSPAANLSVMPSSMCLSNDYFVHNLRIPEEVRQLLARQTDKNGQVRVSRISGAQIFSLDFFRTDLGLQHYVNSRTVPSRLTLLPVGTLAGEVQRPEGAKADLSVVRLRFSTTSKAARATGGWVGIAETNLDRQGKFHIPAIGTGPLRMSMISPEEFPFGLAAQSTSPTITAGATAKLELPLKAAVKFTNLVREARTKQPLPGIGVHLYADSQSIFTMTSPDGRFSAWILPDVAYYTTFDHGPDFVHRFIEAMDKRRIFAGPQADPIAPAELLRARQLTGIVVSPSGERLSDVNIGFDWKDPQEDYQVTVGDPEMGRDYVKADARGAFCVHGPVDTELTLVPFRAGFAIGPAVKISPADKGSIRIRTLPFDLASIQGKVADTTGRGIENTWVEIWYRKPGDPKERLSFSVKTDSKGRYVAPAYFPRNYEYQIRSREVVTGLRAKPTHWQTPHATNETFPDLIIQSQAQLPEESLLRSIRRNDPLGPRNARGLNRTDLIASPEKSARP